MQRIQDLEGAAIEGGIGNNGGLGDLKDSSIKDGKIARLFRASENGCDECNKKGYKGRLGIYEVLGNSTEVQKLIVSSATSESIQNQAIKEGMVTMQLDGFIKALRGQTSVEEILRVTATES